MWKLQRSQHLAPLPLVALGKRVQISSDSRVFLLSDLAAPASFFFLLVLAFNDGFSFSQLRPRRPRFLAHRCGLQASLASGSQKVSPPNARSVIS
jgi:hypothetical protein